MADRVELDAVKYRAEGIHNALGSQTLGPPGSDVRTTFAAQVLSELQSIHNDLLDLYPDNRDDDPDLTTVWQSLHRERKLVEQLAAGNDPPGTLPGMTWADAFLRAEIAAHAQSLVDEIVTKAQLDGPDRYGAVFRVPGPYQGAEDFAREQLKPQITQLVDLATAFAQQVGGAPMADLFPDFDFRTADPPPGFQVLVRDLIRQLAPTLFPPDGSYVAGDLFDLLLPVYESAGPAAARLALVDVLFLRGQLPALASYAASFPRGTVAAEALNRTIAMLMTAAHDSGYGKIPAGYRSEMDALKFYVDAFMSAVLRRLASAGSLPAAP